MPAVYEYRHVELDKVGRGKRVLKPPGGETSDIFVGTSPGSTPGSTTPTSGKSRRGSSDLGSGKLDRTQDRLFGGDGPPTPAQGDEATPRRVVDRMKSNVFATGLDLPDKGPATSPVLTPSKLTTRRNPITGLLESPSGHKNGFDVSPMNGATDHSPSPRIYRNPPGGKSSGIF